MKKMSTNYYRLRPPITDLDLLAGEKYDILTVWINGGMAGELALAKDEVSEMLDCFALVEDDNKCPLHSYWGGDERGCIVYSNCPELSDDTPVISAYHELLTVGEVKAKHGKGRKEEWPERDILKSGSLNSK